MKYRIERMAIASESFDDTNLEGNVPAFKVTYPEVELPDGATNVSMTETLLVVIPDSVLSLFRSLPELKKQDMAKKYRRAVCTVVYMMPVKEVPIG